LDKKICLILSFSFVIMFLEKSLGENNE